MSDHVLLVSSVIVAAALCASSCDEETPPKPADANVEAAPSPTPSAPDSPSAATVSANFDATEVGAIPAGWRIGETHGQGKPATWATVEASDAPSAPRVFGITHTENSGQTYNVALAEADLGAHVEVQVMVKAITGVQDQGGGVVWRAQGTTDYYIARWNPLEKNVKFYVVQGSHRSELAKADVDLDTSKWHALRVLAEGPRMELFIDEESVLTHSDDELSAAGAVGLWTKADAATLFDDFSASAL